MLTELVRRRGDGNRLTDMNTATIARRLKPLGFTAHSIKRWSLQTAAFLTEEHGCFGIGKTCGSAFTDRGNDGEIFGGEDSTFDHGGSFTSVIGESALAELIKQPWIGAEIKPGVFRGHSITRGVVRFRLAVTDGELRLPLQQVDVSLMDVEFFWWSVCYHALGSDSRVYGVYNIRPRTMLTMLFLLV